MANCFFYVFKKKGHHVLFHLSNWPICQASERHLLQLSFLPHDGANALREKSGQWRPLLEKWCKDTLMPAIWSSPFIESIFPLIHWAHCEPLLHLSAVKHNPTRWGVFGWVIIMTSAGGVEMWVSLQSTLRWIWAGFRYIPRDCPHILSYTGEESRQLSHHNSTDHSF